MGTPDFAVPSFRALISEGYEVVGVFCQPDRPKGRGYRLTACPVKTAALEAGIPVFQPERIKRPEGVEMLRALQPDVCVTAAFGQLLSQEILDIPRHGTINVHASLLPRHRGSAPVHYSILMGDDETGVTTMMTDIGMDTGDILLRARTKITPDDTAGTMTDKLALLGAEVLMETLYQLRGGTLKRQPQNEAFATYEPRLTRESGRIDWTKTRREIDCLARGMDPWPGAFTTLGDGTVKVFSVRSVSDTPSAAPGTIVRADAKQGLIAACGDGDLEIVSLQMPGQRRMDAKDYLRGHALPAGTIMGETTNGAE